MGAPRDEPSPPRPSTKRLEIPIGEVSKLARGHMLDFADGVISASKLVEHCHNAVSDGFTQPMVEKIGTLAPGRHAAASVVNVLREIGLSDMQTEVADPVFVTRYLGYQ